MKFLWGRHILDFLQRSWWTETTEVAPGLKNYFAALFLPFPACLALAVMRKKKKKKNCLKFSLLKIKFFSFCVISPPSCLLGPSLCQEFYFLRRKVPLFLQSILSVLLHCLSSPLHPRPPPSAARVLSRKDMLKYSDILCNQ